MAWNNFFKRNTRNTPPPSPTPEVDTAAKIMPDSGLVTSAPLRSFRAPHYAHSAPQTNTETFTTVPPSQKSSTTQKKNIEKEKTPEEQALIDRLQSLVPNLDVNVPNKVLQTWIDARREAGAAQGRLMEKSGLALLDKPQDPPLSKAEILAQQTQARERMSNDPMLEEDRLMYEKARNIRDTAILLMHQRRTRYLSHLVPHPVAKFMFESDRAVAEQQMSRETVRKEQKRLEIIHRRAPRKMVIEKLEDPLSYKGTLHDIRALNAQGKNIEIGSNEKAHVVLGTLHTNSNNYDIPSAIDFVARGDLSEKIIRAGKGSRIFIMGTKEGASLRVTKCTPEQTINRGIDR